KLANFPNITGNICYYQIDPLEPGTYPFNCNTSIIGRYVRLIVRTTELSPINTCEVEVLVSSSRYEEIYLKREKNTQLLATPLLQLTVRNFFLCARECLFRRSIYCTAVNWVTTTGSCQLLSVNPYVDYADNLISDEQTDFYIQSN
ncbi:fucolectin-7, partial [Biomphalaria glabrata]